MHACPLVDEAILYSLHQMAPEEERAYDAHIAVCLTCRMKLSEVQDTLELLPLASPATAPPPGLKAKVLERVAAEATARPTRDAELKRRRFAGPVWAAAAVVALAVGSYSLINLREVSRELAVMKQNAPVERTVTMVGTDQAPGATGRVVVARERTGTRLALQARGLPPLKPGEAYHLWLIKDGQRRSGGVFVVDATGTGGVATWLPEEAEFDALGITREPDAFSQQPRGMKVMGSGA